MDTQIFTNLNPQEFKELLKSVVREVLREEKPKDFSTDTFSIREAAAYLKIKVTTLYEKTSKKLIPHFKKGNKLYFKKAELEEWINAGKINTNSEMASWASNYLLKEMGKKRR